MIFWDWILIKVYWLVHASTIYFFHFHYSNSSINCIPEQSRSTFEMCTIWSKKIKKCWKTNQDILLSFSTYKYPRYSMHVCTDCFWCVFRQQFIFFVRFLQIPQRNELFYILEIIIYTINNLILFYLFYVNMENHIFDTFRGWLITFLK